MGLAQADPPTGASALETIKGTGCYAYGDNETPALTKNAATTLPQEEAVRSYRVFVQSKSKVKNFQLEEELVQTAGSAMLQQIQTEKQPCSTCGSP